MSRCMNVSLTLKSLVSLLQELLFLWRRDDIVSQVLKYRKYYFVVRVVNYIVTKVTFYL